MPSLMLVPLAVSEELKQTQRQTELRFIYLVLDSVAVGLRFWGPAKNRGVGVNPRISLYMVF